MDGLRTRQLVRKLSWDFSNITRIFCSFLGGYNASLGLCLLGVINPWTSKVAILRTNTPLLYRFIHPSIGGSNDS